MAEGLITRASTPGRAIRVLVLKREEPVEPGMSQAQIEDPLYSMAQAGRVIEPPYDLFRLACMTESSSELGQDIDALINSIDGFGHHFVLRKHSIEADIEPEVRAERARLNNFFNYASLKMSFIELRRRLRRDIELTGNGYLELIRDSAGQPSGFEFIPSYQVRLTAEEATPVLAKIPVLVEQPDGSVRREDMPAYARFRRYAHSRAYGGYRAGYDVRWFKELSDPRVYSNLTGELVEEALPLAERANELIHFKVHTSRTPYGVPRFLGNMHEIVGDQAAAEVNLTTLENNNIPALALMVSNGQISQASIDRIQDFVEQKAKGNRNYGRVLIIETEGQFEGEDPGNAKMDLKPLTSEQHSDALFQNYRKSNRAAIRSSFRLPAVFVGAVEEYSRDVVDSAREIADEQVFAPERNEFDTFINLRLFPLLNIVHHRFKSSGPNTTNNRELVSLLSSGERTGALTPRIGRLVVEDVLGVELPAFKADPRFDPDLPFSLLMAEAVKNRADPTEPGQQVTALKGVETVKGTETDAIVEAVIARLRERGTEP